MQLKLPQSCSPNNEGIYAYGPFFSPICSRCLLKHFFIEEKDWAWLKTDKSPLLKVPLRSPVGVWLLVHVSNHVQTTHPV